MQLESTCCAVSPHAFAVQADHALRKEMRALQLHCNDIDAHEAALDAQIRRLDRAREQVEAHLRDKDEGEQVWGLPELSGPSYSPVLLALLLSELCQ